jgi:hypothetical protein
MSNLDVLSQVASGVSKYAELTGDLGLAVQGGVLIPIFQADLAKLVTPEDTVLLAFPCVVTIPERSLKGLFVSLGNRRLVLWQTGVFKKVTNSRVVTRAEGRRVSLGKLAEGPLKGTRVLTVRDESKKGLIQVALTETAFASKAFFDAV